MYRSSSIAPMHIEKQAPKWTLFMQLLKQSQYLQAGWCRQAVSTLGMIENISH